MVRRTTPAGTSYLAGPSSRLVGEAFDSHEATSRDGQDSLNGEPPDSLARSRCGGTIVYVGMESRPTQAPEEIAADQIDWFKTQELGVTVATPGPFSLRVAGSIGDRRTWHQAFVAG